MTTVTTTMIMTMGMITTMGHDTKIMDMTTATGTASRMLVAKNDRA